MSKLCDNRDKQNIFLNKRKKIWFRAFEFYQALNSSRNKRQETTTVVSFFFFDDYTCHEVAFSLNYKNLACFTFNPTVYLEKVRF